jgi:hypothetical protein
MGVVAPQHLKKQKKFFGQHGVSPSWSISRLFSDGEKLAHLSEAGLAILAIDQGQ